MLTRSLLESFHLLAALQRCRTRADVRIRDIANVDSDSIRLPWFREPQYNVHPGDVIALTHVWWEDVLVLSSLKSLSASLSNPTLDEHTALLSEEGGSLATFKTPSVVPHMRLPEEVQWTTDGILPISDALDLDDFLRTARAACEPLKGKLKAEVLLVWKRPLGYRTLDHNVLATCVVHRSVNCDLATAFDDEMHIHIHPRDGLIWTIYVSSGGFVGKPHEFPEYDPEGEDPYGMGPKIVTRDGIVMYAKQGHCGDMDTWLELNVKLATALPSNWPPGSNMHQQHKVTKLELVLINLNGERESRASLTSDSAFRKVLARLEWT